MSVSGGLGIMNIYSGRDDILVEGLGCGAVRAAFGYAISDRWSLGIHYDRVGSAWHNGAVDRLYMSNHLLSVAYRPWVSAYSAFELEIAFGPTTASLFMPDTRLPYTATGSALSGGVRYLGMMSGTIGAFVALDHVASSSEVLTHEHGSALRPGNEAVRIQWNSPRVTAGLLVRF